MSIIRIDIAQYYGTSEFVRRQLKISEINVRRLRMTGLAWVAGLQPLWIGFNMTMQPWAGLLIYF